MSRSRCIAADWVDLSGSDSLSSDPKLWLRSLAPPLFLFNFSFLSLSYFCTSMSSPCLRLSYIWSSLFAATEYLCSKIRTKYLLSLCYLFLPGTALTPLVLLPINMARLCLSVQLSLRSSAGAQKSKISFASSGIPTTGWLYWRLSPAPVG